MLTIWAAHCFVGGIGGPRVLNTVRAFVWELAVAEGAVIPIPFEAH